MRYNRLIIILTAAVVLLSSCSGSFGTIVPDYEKYDGLLVNNIEVNVVYNFASGSLAAFTELAAEFSDINNYGIKVNLIPTGSSAGEADLVFDTPASAAALLRSGKSIELSPISSHPAWGLENGRGIFYPAARKQTDYFDFARKITSIPILMNTGIIIVNKDLLRAAGFTEFPTSWLGFDRLLRKSSELAKPVIGMQINADSVISVINARGGSILRPVGFAYSLNNPVVNRTLRYLRNLEEDGILSDNRTNYLNQTMFAFGKLTAVFTENDSIPYYDELSAMTDPQLDWEVALLPTRKPGDGTVINCSCSAAVMKGQAEKELASWLFIKWLTEDAQQKKLAELTYSFPVTLSSAAAILAQESDVYTPRWLDALRLVDEGYKELIPSLSDYNEVSEAFNLMLERVRAGEWVWLETLKLDWNVKKMRRQEYKIRTGRK